MLAIHDLLRPFQVLCCGVVMPQTAEMQLDIQYMNGRRNQGHGDVTGTTRRSCSV